MGLPAAYAGTVNPLSEVISLLDSLAEKITKEGNAEAKAYKEFFAWCDDVSRNKQFEIRTATAQQEKLQADIAKETGNGQASAAKIEDLVASIANDDANLRDAAVIRKKRSWRICSQR